MAQAVDYWVTVHSLKSLDGGILDQDDRLIDVVDDREQVYNLSSPAVGGGVKQYRYPSVCLSQPYVHSCRIGYGYTGCLQRSYVRTADPSADGRRSAASRTAIGGGISSRRPRGDNLFTRW